VLINRRADLDKQTRRDTVATANATGLYYYNLYCPLVYYNYYNTVYYYYS